MKLPVVNTFLVLRYFNLKSRIRGLSKSLYLSGISNFKLFNSLKQSPQLLASAFLINVRIQSTLLLNFETTIESIRDALIFV